MVPALGSWEERGGPFHYLTPGARCPACDRGRLYAMAPLVRLRFSGQPLVTVTRYDLERLRCSACGALFVAHLPSGVNAERYDTRLKVILAVAHYHLGLPFNRLEALQHLLGLPLPDATQWDLVEQVADVGYQVFEAAKVCAAQQPLVFQDDTGARVLSLLKDNQAVPPPARKAIYTTVLRCVGAHTICLFFTGRQHAGENLDDLLALRDPALPPMLWMSDALAANTPKRHGAGVVDLNCLVHARRQFVDIQAFFPDACEQVIATIATVYRHEAQCVTAQLTPAQRLVHLQTHSAPVMAALKAWMEQQVADHQVEPNSRLGQAFNYMLKRWAALTGFLRLPGAQLDNNDAYAASGICVVMPHPRLCRMAAHKLTRRGWVSDSWHIWSRHNHSPFKKKSQQTIVGLEPGRCCLSRMSAAEGPLLDLHVSV